MSGKEDLSRCSQDIEMRKMVKGWQGRPQSLLKSGQNEMQSFLFEKQERVTMKHIKL